MLQHAGDDQKGYSAGLLMPTCSITLRALHRAPRADPANTSRDARSHRRFGRKSGSRAAHLSAQAPRRNATATAASRPPPLRRLATTYAAAAEITVCTSQTPPHSNLSRKSFLVTLGPTPRKRMGTHIRISGDSRATHHNNNPPPPTLRPHRKPQQTAAIPQE